MTLKYMAEFRDSQLAQGLVQRIRELSVKKVRLMEVCGTHTMALFRSGVRSLLPETITLLSGPGCPVCVTAQREIDAFIELACQPDVIVTTFGDLMRVPGSRSSLQQERAQGKDIRIVYSTFDALTIAAKNPDRKVVFLGVGFETTAPTIAASIQAAQQMGRANYAVFSAHKLVPPALTALLETKDIQIDGFLLPGHVSVILGSEAYRPVIDKYRIPAAVAGFEPTDLLQAIDSLIEQIENKQAQLANCYARAVTRQGNRKAQQLLDEVFEVADAAWRGLGTIPASGLKIRRAYEAFDAENVFDLKVPEVPDPKGCACGSILTGQMTPPECPLYKTVCQPEAPVGPCMVSSEGTCAAYYRYHSQDEGR